MTRAGRLQRARREITRLEATWRASEARMHRCAERLIVVRRQVRELEAKS